MYKSIKEPNVSLNGKKSTFIYIPTGANYIDVVNLLYENNYIINRSAFEWVAEKKNYPNNDISKEVNITEVLQKLVKIFRMCRQKENFQIIRSSFLRL